MPLLERARNLRDLDVLIHQGGYRPDLKSTYFKNLIIARLVSNPNYEALVQAQLRIHEATGGITLEDFKKLVKYLKEEVVPLA